MADMQSQWPNVHSSVGWIYGSTDASDALRGPVENFHIKVEPHLNQNLQRFWEFEEFSSENIIIRRNVLRGDV